MFISSINSLFESVLLCQICKMIKNIFSLGWLSVVGVVMAGCANGYIAGSSADPEQLQLTLHDIAIPVVTELSETQCRSDVAQSNSSSREVVCLKAPDNLSAEAFDKAALRQIELIDNVLGAQRDEMKGSTGWSIGCGRIFFLALVPEELEEFEPDLTDIPEGLELSEILEMINQQMGNPEIALEYDQEHWCDPDYQADSSIRLTDSISIQAPAQSRVIPDCRPYLDSDIRDDLSADWEDADVFACIRTQESTRELFRLIATQIESHGLDRFTDDYYGVLRYKADCARISLSAFPPMNELPWRSPSVAIESISNFYCNGPSG